MEISTLNMAQVLSPGKSSTEIKRVHNLWLFSTKLWTQYDALKDAYFGSNHNNPMMYEKLHLDHNLTDKLVDL